MYVAGCHRSAEKQSCGKKQKSEMEALWQLHKKRAQLLQINWRRRELIGKPVPHPTAFKRLLPRAEKKLPVCKTTVDFWTSCHHHMADMGLPSYLDNV